MSRTFLAWTRYNRRSDLMAQHFGATMHHLRYGQNGNILQAPFRYVVLAYRTWGILRRERPEVIFIQNPPIFCVLLAYFYTRLHGGGYVIDSHTAAFLSPKWRWSLGLHGFLSRRAITTIVTNNTLREQVEGWGCRAFVLGFTPAEYPAGTPYPLGEGFSLVVVSAYAEDEPLDVVFDAARRLPDVSFYVSGDSKRIAPDLLAKKPENCRLTGYLDYEQYVGLMRQADGVVDLTNRDHTLLLGAFEAVSLGTPLIVSDWPILQEYFSRGTVHVANNVDSLCDGVHRAQRDQAVLKKEIVQLRDELQAEWEQNRIDLENVLADSVASIGSTATVESRGTR
ncbi:MAG: hypothetical protein ABI670_04530 [Chloroflexota bacterium]